MKARRNFVVEFKSNRRQARPRSASIWGDTDLKAIARDLEDEMPAAGGRIDADDADRTHGRPPLVPVRSPAEEPDRTDIANDPSPVAPSGDASIYAGTAWPTDETPYSARSADAQVVTDAAPLSAGLDHRAPDKRPPASKIPTPTGKTRSKSRLTAQSWQPDCDELAALETENRRLKSLWRRQLEAENTQLRKMLARLS